MDEEVKPEVSEVEEDFKDKYFRLLAEMENSRKRMQKERSELTRFAIDRVLTEMITPFETFEKALGFADQMSDETKNWAFGFQMILAQFKEILHAHGVVAFSSMGEKFDPHRHEAVEVEETSEHEEGTILQEFLRGYKSGERILRPARVKVAKQVNNEEKSYDRQEEK